jgi:hypothetical protein
MQAELTDSYEEFAANDSDNACNNCDEYQVVYLKTAIAIPVTCRYCELREEASWNQF